MLDLYRMDDADVALFLLNSAAETAKDAADRLRERGIRAGVVSPNVIRPFPARQLREALAGVTALLIGERADSYGAHGGNLGHEVKSALKDDPDNRTLCLDRIYGLGGRDFYAEDAEALFELTLEAADAGRVDVPFDYYGAVAEVRPGPRKHLPPIAPEETRTDGLIKVEQGENGLPASRDAARLAARCAAQGGRAGPQRLPWLRRLPRPQPLLQGARR